MTDWKDSRSHTGFGTAPSGGFPYDFNTVDRLGPLHETGHAVGRGGRRAYGAMGLDLKSHNSHQHFHKISSRTAIKIQE